MRMYSLRLALVAATLAATTLVAHASPLAAPGQDAPAQGRPQRGPGGDMFKDLNLSADQQTKIDALLKEERAQRGSRPQGPPSDADRKAMETRRADMDAKLKGILTPEQYTKYQAKRPQGGPGKGGQRPAREE